MSDNLARFSLSDKAVALIAEMKRNPDVLPPYNDETMRACAQGVEDLFQEIATVNRAVNSGEASQETLQINKSRLEVVSFVIRCCEAYVAERASRIKSYRWKFGGALPASIRNNLSEDEIEFFNNYSAALADYQLSFGTQGLDLTERTHPPTTLLMKVRVKENYCEIETSTGNLLVLHPGSIHNLPRQDCERLIKQGILELAQ